MDIPYRFNHPDDSTENPAGTPTNPVKKPEDAPPRDPAYQYSGYTPSSQFKIAFARHNDMNVSLTLIQGNSVDGWVTYVKTKSPMILVETLDFFILQMHLILEMSSLLKELIGYLSFQ